MTPRSGRCPSAPVTPLTTGGRVVAVLGVLACTVGALLDWAELLTLGTACLLAVGVGVPLVVGRHRLDVERSLSSHRVSVGDEAEAMLRFERHAGRRRWAGPSPVFEDQVDGRRVTLGRPHERVPTDATAHVVRYRLPTDRRGVFTVGPAVAVKADLLGLLRREVRQTGVDHLWVLPRTAPLMPLGVGFAQNLEGPTSDSSPAGDVSFHGLRNYELGDDHRHIHWLSTARAGTLMVRHHVDNRLPCLTLVLDDRPGPGFETAVEIVASVMNAHVQAGLPVTVVAADRRLAGPPASTLDELCLLQPRAVETSTVETSTVESGTVDPRTAVAGLGDQRLGAWVDGALAARSDTSVLVIVTAAASPTELARACGRARGRAHTVAVRVGGDPLPGRMGSATVVRAETLESFARFWNRQARP